MFYWRTYQDALVPALASMQTGLTLQDLLTLSHISAVPVYLHVRQILHT